MNLTCLWKIHQSVHPWPEKPRSLSDRKSRESLQPPIRIFSAFASNFHNTDPFISCGCLQNIKRPTSESSYFRFSFYFLRPTMCGSPSLMTRICFFPNHARWGSTSCSSYSSIFSYTHIYTYKYTTFIYITLASLVPLFLFCCFFCPFGRFFRRYVIRMCVAVRVRLEFRMGRRKYRVEFIVFKMSRIEVLP